MCYRTVCPNCHKPTWAGCGDHIEQALQGVAEEDRCQCNGASGPKVIATEVPITQSIPPAPLVAVPVQQLRLIKSLTGHSDRVWHTSVHPSLPIIATASADKTARLFSSKDFHLLGVVEGNHKRSIRSCSWKPGEPKPVLATASFDGTAGIWDCQGDELTGEGEWECAGLLEGHENEVKDVAWSASGTLLATCSRDKSIWIWECENYEDPECLSVMQEHTQDVKCVVWHPVEELLASGSYDDQIRLWRDDGDDWICCSILEGHEGTVWSIDFEKGSTGTARLASASADSTVRIWKRTSDPAAGLRKKDALPSIIRPSLDQVWELETILPRGHDGNIYTLAWNHETGMIATSGEDGTICVYKENADQKWVLCAQHQNAHGVFEVNHVTWGSTTAASARLYSSGDNGVVNIWDVAI